MVLKTCCSGTHMVLRPFLCGAETLLIHVQTHVIRELIHRLIDECREYHTLVPSLWY